jgi:hypothetical protein
MKTPALPLIFCSVFTFISFVAVSQPDLKKQAFQDVATIQTEPVSATSNTANSSNTMASFRDIPVKAVRSFKNSWEYVDNETWYKVPDGYRARFTEDHVLYLVNYNRNGKWLSTLRQYDETKFDRTVRGQVKSVYYDYNILLIEEIEQPMKPVTYIIHMEDRTSFKNIRVCDREMEVVTEIDKL